MLQDEGSGVRAAGLRLAEQTSALDGIDLLVGAGFLLELKSVTPSGELVGPGLDGVDIAPRGVRHERARPAVVAVHGHRLASPLPVDLAAPDQRRGDHLVPVAVDIGPHLHGLADDPFDRKAAAIDRGEDVFNMESAGSALDRLRSFVHGDAAIDVEMLFRTQEGDMPGLYRKPLAKQWFPGNARRSSALDTLYPLPFSGQFYDALLTFACKPRAE